MTADNNTLCKVFGQRGVMVPETVQSLNKEAIMARAEQYKDWLSLGKVAGYCLASRATVRRWIKTDKLAAIRLPSGYYRVNVMDLRGFPKQHDMPIKNELFASESGGGNRNTADKGNQTWGSALA